MRWLFGKPKKAASLDDLTLLQLAKAGGDLSQPTDVVNYLYVPDRARAEQAALELRAAGYTVEVRPAASGSNWLALARRDMVPSGANIQENRARFEAIAARLGGDFDGWEAAVTK